MSMIECTSVYGHKTLVPKEKLIFRLSVYGLIVDDGKALLIHARSTGKYYLPGGGVEVGERIKDALRREVKEETGIEVEVGEFAHFEEDFFYYDPLNEAYHGLLLYYLCKPKTLDVVDDEHVEDEEAERPRWIDIRALHGEDFLNHGEIILELLHRCYSQAGQHTKKTQEDELKETVMVLPSMRVDGKVAIVTGAGSGIGKAIAEALAEAGADCVPTELPENTARLEPVCEAIRKSGRRALPLPLRLPEASSIDAFVAKTIEEMGRVDLLVNNAGVNIPRDALELTEEDWDGVLDVNLKGLFFLSQRVAREMKETGGGKIVNIASQMGVVGYYKRAAYCSSKAGVVNLTRVLAVEWAQYKINVNAVGPTFILTPLTQSTFDDPVLREDLLRRIPLGRVGRPQDVVGAVVFLASPAADLITGHTLLVDGGWTAL